MNVTMLGCGYVGLVSGTCFADFGTPSFIVNNKLFWGQDRLEFAVNEAAK